MPDRSHPARKINLPVVGPGAAATLAKVSVEKTDDAEPVVPAAEVRLLAQRLAALLRVVHEFAEDRSERSGLAVRIGEHLGTDPLDLPVLAEELPPYQLIDVEVALEVWASGPGRSSEVVGVTGEQRRMHPLGELLRMGRHVDVGPVEYQDLADSPSTTRRCVRFGLFLLVDGARRLAVLVRNADPHGPMQEAAMLEVIADDEAAGRQLLVDLRAWRSNTACCGARCSPWARERANATASSASSRAHRWAGASWSCRTRP